MTPSRQLRVFVKLHPVAMGPGLALRAPRDDSGGRGPTERNPPKYVPLGSVRVKIPHPVFPVY
ncbi:hypothetical protein ACVIW2_005170 [Bradyrhizobium huanghuaihaiense]|uniref:Uncharacterized protein n=1 Tax=Bradyrhizobium huanghuaihaiense TaxID=990078 RepID=A0A562R8G7_9BRAD|nr:hypothetical protein IQ16_05512 [Bradyrhizobium huanghuaihaiense]